MIRKWLRLKTDDTEPLPPELSFLTPSWQWWWCRWSSDEKPDSTNSGSRWTLLPLTQAVVARLISHWYPWLLIVVIFWYTMMLSSASAYRCSPRVLCRQNTLAQRDPYLFKMLIFTVKGNLSGHLPQLKDCEEKENLASMFTPPAGSLPAAVDPPWRVSFTEPNNY